MSDTKNPVRDYAVQLYSNIEGINRRRNELVLQLNYLNSKGEGSSTNLQEDIINYNKILNSLLHTYSTIHKLYGKDTEKKGGKRRSSRGKGGPSRRSRDSGRGRRSSRKGKGFIRRSARDERGRQGSRTRSMYERKRVETVVRQQKESALKKEIDALYNQQKDMLEEFTNNSGKFVPTKHYSLDTVLKLADKHKEMFPHYNLDVLNKDHDSLVLQRRLHGIQAPYDSLGSKFTPYIVKLKFSDDDVVQHLMKQPVTTMKESIFVENFVSRTVNGVAMGISEIMSRLLAIRHIYLNRVDITTSPQDTHTILSGIMDFLNPLHIDTDSFKTRVSGHDEEATLLEQLKLYAAQVYSSYYILETADPNILKVKFESEDSSSVIQSILAEFQHRDFMRHEAGMDTILLKSLDWESIQSRTSHYITMYVSGRDVVGSISTKSQKPGVLKLREEIKETYSSYAKKTRVSGKGPGIPVSLMLPMMMMIFTSVASAESMQGNFSNSSNITDLSQISMLDPLNVSTPSLSIWNPSSLQTCSIGEGPTPPFRPIDLRRPSIEESTPIPIASQAPTTHSGAQPLTIDNPYELNGTTVHPRSEELVETPAVIQASIPPVTPLRFEEPLTILPDVIDQETRSNIPNLKFSTLLNHVESGEIPLTYYVASRILVEQKKICKAMVYDNFLKYIPFLEKDLCRITFTDSDNLRLDPEEIYSKALKNVGLNDLTRERVLGVDKVEDIIPILDSLHKGIMTINELLGKLDGATKGYRVIQPELREVFDEIDIPVGALVPNSFETYKGDPHEKNPIFTPVVMKDLIVGKLSRWITQSTHVVKTKLNRIPFDNIDDREITINGRHTTIEFTKRVPGLIWDTIEKKTVEHKIYGFPKNPFTGVKTPMYHAQLYQLRMLDTIMTNWNDDFNSKRKKAVMELFIKEVPDTEHPNFEKVETIFKNEVDSFITPRRDILEQNPLLKTDIQLSERQQELLSEHFVYKPNILKLNEKVESAVKEIKLVEISSDPTTIQRTPEVLKDQNDVPFKTFMLPEVYNDMFVKYGYDNNTITYTNNTRNADSLYQNLGFGSHVTYDTISQRRIFFQQYEGEIRMVPGRQDIPSGYLSLGKLGVYFIKEVENIYGSKITKARKETIVTACIDNFRYQHNQVQNRLIHHPFRDQIINGNSEIPIKAMTRIIRDRVIMQNQLNPINYNYNMNQTELDDRLREQSQPEAPEETGAGNQTQTYAEYIYNEFTEFERYISGADQHLQIPEITTKISDIPILPDGTETVYDSPFHTRLMKLIPEDQSEETYEEMLTRFEENLENFESITNRGLALVLNGALGSPVGKAIVALDVVSTQAYRILDSLGDSTGRVVIGGGLRSTAAFLSYLITARAFHDMSVIIFGLILLGYFVRYAGMAAIFTTSEVLKVARKMTFQFGEFSLIPAYYGLKGMASLFYTDKEDTRVDDFMQNMIQYLTIGVSNIGHLLGPKEEGGEEEGEEEGEGEGEEEGEGEGEEEEEEAEVKGSVKSRLKGAAAAIDPQTREQIRQEIMDEEIRKIEQREKERLEHAKKTKQYESEQEKISRKAMDSPLKKAVAPKDPMESAIEELDGGKRTKIRMKRRSRSKSRRSKNRRSKSRRKRSKKRDWQKM